MKDSASDALERLPDSANETTELSTRLWWPEKSLEWLAGLLLLILTLFVTVTVLMRFSGNGVLGAVEISAIAMVVITALVVPAATAADDNFKVEIVDMFNKPGLVRAATVLGAVVQVVVSLFLAFSSLELLIYDWNTKTTMAGELSMPRYLLSFVVFLSFAVLLHATILFLVQLLRSRGNNGTEGSEGTAGVESNNPEGA
ncbi:TRAP transporter small permease subunit [Corynebacterium hylobatis]|uniref:TRAP transporter small permease subunit n=2 Tax=Corynebacterium hylobatis TaxID=1859290 RepID=A0A430HY55_9CORY|nr:TRAP transporter small permease subunit [Corynebacterium hylobatis]